MNCWNLLQHESLFRLIYLRNIDIDTAILPTPYKYCIEMKKWYQSITIKYYFSELLKLKLSLKNKKVTSKTQKFGFLFKIRPNPSQIFLRLKQNQDLSASTAIFGMITLSVHLMCWRPAMHAQTWATYNAVYRLSSLSAMSSVYSPSRSRPPRD